MRPKIDFKLRAWREVSRVAVLSTQHQTLQNLALQAMGRGCCIAITEYGSIYYTPTSFKDVVVPPHIKKILKQARKDGLRYVMFDRDAPVDSRFEVFKHE